MKTPKLLFAAVALGLSGCATYPPAPPYGAASVTVSSKAPFGTWLVDGRGMAL